MNTRITNGLNERCQGTCELCTTEQASIAYAVSPKNNDAIENEVAICNNCLSAMENKDAALHWQCLAGSIWNTEPSVQALSYRILYSNKEQDWANEIISSVELDEPVINWAMSAFEKVEIHKDSNGTSLSNGDTIVLTQGLNVKGANFMAPKGTIVRKIRLVPDNTEQIEGKINDQTIVILTKFVRKS
jgi:protein PhnA